MKYTRRWPYFLAAIVTGFFQGTLYTWTFIRDELRIVFPTWSAGDLSIIFSIHNVTVCVALIATGVLLKRLSSRTMLFFSGSAMAIGFGLFPLLPADKPELAFGIATILFGIVAASSVGISTISGYSLYTQWAPDHTGKLLGAIVLAHSLAPVFLSAFCNWLIPMTGVLEAVRWVGIGSAVLLFLTLPLARPPGPDDLLPAAPVRIDNPDRQEFKPSQMLRTPAFWTLFAFNVAMRSGGLIIIDFGGSIALAFGMSALLGLVYSPSNGIANITGGILIDKYGTARVMVICSCTLLIGSVIMLTGNSGDNGILVIAGLLVSGLSYGGCLVQNAASMRFLFGSKNYAQNFGYVQSSIIFSAFTGYFTGGMIDRQNGDFSGVFLLLLCLAAVGITSGFVMGSLMKKRRKMTIDN